MLGRARRQVDARAPGLMQRVGGRVDHAGQHLDAVQLAHRRRRQDGLDRRAQAFVVDRSGEAAGEPRCRLLEGHDLQAVAAVARRHQAAFPHGEAAVNDEGGSNSRRTWSLSFRALFLVRTLGRLRNSLT